MLCLSEIGISVDNGATIIKIDPRYFRPTEVESLLGDASKAHKNLNWLPKITLEGLVSDMIEHDLKIANQELLTLNGKNNID